MSQGFRTYKERRNPSYNYGPSKFYDKTGTAPGDVNSEFTMEDFLALVI